MFTLEPGTFHCALFEPWELHIKGASPVYYVADRVRKQRVGSKRAPKIVFDNELKFDILVHDARYCRISKNQIAEQCKIEIVDHDGHLQAVRLTVTEHTVKWVKEKIRSMFDDSE